MSQFNFRLNKVRDLRQRERDAAAEAYGQARLAIEKLQAQVEQVVGEHASQTPARLTGLQSTVNSQQVLEVERYQMHLMQQVLHLRSQIELIQVEAEKRRQNLLQCEQAVQALDRLEKRQKEEWESHNQQRAQVALDEWAAFRYWKDASLPASSTGRKSW